VRSLLVQETSSNTCRCSAKAGNRELYLSLCTRRQVAHVPTPVTSPCGRCSTHASSLCALSCVTRVRPVTTGSTCSQSTTWQ
jgi:hypothetical protein